MSLREKLRRGIGYKFNGVSYINIESHFHALGQQVPPFGRCKKASRGNRVAFFVLSGYSFRRRGIRMTVRDFAFHFCPAACRLRRGPFLLWAFVPLANCRGQNCVVHLVHCKKGQVMNKLAIALLVGLVVCLVGTTVAFAEDAKCEGTIAKIEGSTVTVKTATDSHTLTCNDKTKVTIDGSPAKLSDLKVGQKVKCTGTKEGDKVTCTVIDASKA
jgi:hypothetical protein